MIHVEQKNFLKKKWDKKTRQKQQKITTKATTQAKKPATLKKREYLSKDKANTVYCDFYYDFVWFSMDFEEK
ncbi:MAG: hypothetical protein IKC29_00005 [Clostridia bacterium]|nr:hypothetical protein [Clostridia bacterium]